MGRPHKFIRLLSLLFRGGRFQIWKRLHHKFTIHKNVAELCKSRISASKYSQWHCAFKMVLIQISPHLFVKCCSSTLMIEWSLVTLQFRGHHDRPPHSNGFLVLLLSETKDYTSNSRYLSEMKIPRTWGCMNSFSDVTFRIVVVSRMQYVVVCKDGYVENC